MKANPAAIRANTVFTLLFVLCPAAQAENQTSMTPKCVDIFTTADHAIRAIDVSAVNHSTIDVRIHQLDAIQQFQDKLSQGLPTDQDKAKRLVLERLQRLSKRHYNELQRSARSLTKAVQYGVEQYPAIVFDSELVIYGITDLSVALARYRDWLIRQGS